MVFTLEQTTNKPIVKVINNLGHFDSQEGFVNMDRVAGKDSRSRFGDPFFDVFQNTLGDEFC